MSLYSFQSQPYSLAGAGALPGDVTLTLKSMLSIDGDSLVMSTDFGSIGYGTIEPGSGTNEEQISFTGLTNNSNGTTTLTGVKSVTFQEPYTETTGLLKTHAGSTVFVISNTSAFTSSFANKNNAEIITQNWQVPDPVGMTDIANKEYVLSVVSGGTVSVDKVIVAGTAGETVSAGNVLYLKTDGKWWKADSSAVASSVNVLLGIAQGAGTANNPIATGVLIEGLDQNQSGLVAGSAYYLTNTPGTISTTPGTFSVQVGVGSTNASRLFFQTSVGKLSLALVSTTSKANGVPQANSSGFISNGWLGNLFTADVDQSQTTSNSTVTVGEANATTKHALLAEKFVPAVPAIRGVKLWKIADSASFTGTVTVSLQADSSGSPSGVNLASSTITNAQWLLLASAAEFSVAFGTPYTSMTVGGSYWIVITTSTNDNTNHPNLGANSAGGYASGALKYQNGTDGWVLIPTSILYFKTLEGVVSQIVQTDTDGMVPTVLSKYSLIELNNTPVSIASSTAETTVYTKQLDGGFLGTNKGIRIRATFTMLNTGTSTVATFALYFNGNALSNTTSGAVAVGANNVDGIINYVDFIILNNGAANSQKNYSSCQPLFQSGTATITTASLTAATIGVAAFTTSAVDTAPPGTLKLTMTNNTTQACTTTFRGLIIEKIG